MSGVKMTTPVQWAMIDQDVGASEVCMLFVLRTTRDELIPREAILSASR